MHLRIPSKVMITCRHVGGRLTCCMHDALQCSLIYWALLLPQCLCSQNEGPLDRLLPSTTARRVFTPASTYEYNISTPVARSIGRCASSGLLHVGRWRIAQPLSGWTAAHALVALLVRSFPVPSGVCSCLIISSEDHRAKSTYIHPMSAYIRVEVREAGIGNGFNGLVCLSHPALHSTCWT